MPKAALMLGLAVGFSAAAADGRLLATPGAVTVEGGAGGGIVPWAVLTGYGERGQQGGSVTVSRVTTRDYQLDVAAVGWSWNNRLELSLARQDLDLGTLRRLAGLPADARLRQNVVGMKLRLAGELVYSRMPQVSVGAQHKNLLDAAIPLAVGATADSSTDVYVSASKLFLGAANGLNLVLSTTLRSTRANQTGLLGFGGDRRNDRKLLAEGSVALFLHRRFAVGLEYRDQPDNLRFARSDAWKDAFVAWFPRKWATIVLAYVDLGSVAGLEDQTGWYLSLQFNPQ